MNRLQASIAAVHRGTTEPCPASGLCHAVVPPALPGWNLGRRGAAVLPFADEPSTALLDAATRPSAA